MAGEYDVNKADTTELDNLEAFSVASKTLDLPDKSKKETKYDFPDADEAAGYYKTIGALKKAVDTFAIWVVGKGVTVDIATEIMLERVTGWGEDTFQSIMENLIIQKKIFKDSFAEIIEDEKTGDLLNLKPLYTGNMSTVVNPQGIIIRYEHRNTDGTITKFEPNQILHLCNDRIGNEIHGTDVIESAKWAIDARNEAVSDERKIRHRELALGVMYVDTDDTSKLNKIKEQYGEAIKKGEVLVLPMKTAEIKDTGITPTDRLPWIQYLDNSIYQEVGIPKVMVNSQDYSEASSKVGYMTFEPVYTREQTMLEADIWNQLALRVKFNRPPSLHGLMQEEESKNVGQVGIEPSEVTATPERVE